MSTQVPREAPRESSSKLMFPVPEKRSRNWISERSFRVFRRLKRLSLAKSVVGRVGMFFGGLNFHDDYMQITQTWFSVGKIIAILIFVLIFNGVGPR